MLDKESDWTIITYIDGDNNLEYPLYGDMNEMEAAVKGDSINIPVLFDRIDGNWDGDGDWTGTRAYLLGNDPDGFNYTLSSETKRLSVESLGLSTKEESELNMGDPYILQTWILFCMDEYPAKNYMLIMSDHGDGWTGKEIYNDQLSRGICWDDTSDNAYISMSEMRKAIEPVLSSSDKLDIIYFDTCLTGMVENLSELSGVCDYLVFSEDNVPSKGAPYFDIFNNFDFSLTPRELSSLIVDKYSDAWSTGEMVDGGYISPDYTLTAVETSGADALMESISLLAAKLVAAPPSGDLRNQVEIMNSSGVPENIDLKDYCRLLSSVSEATEVISRLDAITINFKSGKDHPGSGGLSIYYPTHDTAVSSLYSASRMKFVSTVPEWKEFLDRRNDQSLIDSLEQYGNNTIYEIYNAYYASDQHLMLPPGQEISSYISYSNDIDWFYINDMKTGTVYLTVPDGMDFDLEMYGINLSENTYQSIKVNESPYNLSGSLNESITIKTNLYDYDIYLVTVSGKTGSDYSLNSHYILQYKPEV